MYISLEAVNAFEEWLRRESQYSIYEAKGNLLRELAEDYDVEDLNEILEILMKYFKQNEEYITARQRKELLEGFGLESV